jgi:hypothetical protein
LEIILYIKQWKVRIVMDYNKIEEAVFKKAMEFFKDNAAKLFGINVNIVAPVETEIKNIEKVEDIQKYFG